MNPAYEWWKAEGRKAAEKKLQEIIAREAANVGIQSEQGKLLCEAVAALPDRTKWNLLPETLRDKLETTIVKLEIVYHAEKVREALS